MGPTSPAALAARGAAGKAMGEMADGVRAGHPPVGRNGSQRSKHELAPGEVAMRNVKISLSIATAAPQQEIEIEHSRTPAASAAPAEGAFKGLECRKHRRRLHRTFDEGDRIGKITTGAAMRRIEDNRRGVEQSEILVEPCDRRLDHPRRSAEPSVRAV